MKRFIIRKKTFVHRNTMILGCPIDESFKMFCIVDRNWKDENKSLNFRGYQSSNRMALGSRELRAAFKDELKARKLCAQMNAEYEKMNCPKSISFNVDNAWNWFDEELEVTGFQK